MGMDWINDFSHELRAPLSNLSARLEAMEDGIWPADSVHLSGCRDDVARLLRLVERIESVARAEFIERPGRTVLRMDHVRGNEGRFGIVLSELLSNALQATPAGGQVEVRVIFRGKPPG